MTINICSVAQISNNILSSRYTRSTNSENLLQPVPGYPQVSANRFAQTWNLMNLSAAKTLDSERSSAQNWYKHNVNPILPVCVPRRHTVHKIICHSYVNKVN